MKGSGECASKPPSVAEFEGGSVVLLVVYCGLEWLKLGGRVECTNRVISYLRTGFWDASH